MPGALAFAMAVIVSVGSLQASLRMCDADGWATSKVDLAKVTTQKLANEAFPQWQRDHAADAQPTVEALFAYMDSNDVRDPWGSPYTIEWAPHGLVAHSRGEDLIAGTPDDIWSND